MVPFDFDPRTRIVFGANKIDSIGTYAAELGGSRVLVVSDSGIVKAGHSERTIQHLKAAGLDATLFDQVQENPTTETIEVGLTFAREFQPDLIIGLGGGSSMDTGKGINFLYSNGGKMQDYWGRDKATKPMLPMIAIPTTAGTGSETQSFALISDAETHVKMACGDKKAACKIALLDPVLTITQPHRVTALTGIDALAHALETYVTKPRNAFSLAFSREAFRLLHTNFATVLKEPQNIDAREGMQLGASLAGLAIENSMLGAAHATANPLTAEYGIIHGQAIALMLPHVIRYNGQEFDHWYQELTRISFKGAARNGGAARISEVLLELAEQAGLKTRLRDAGVEEVKLPKLAHAAAKQWTATFNPREVTEQELLAIYEMAY